MHSPGGRFDPRATLRKLGEPGSVLDGLVRRIGERWDRFRHDSSAEAVPALERDLNAALAQLTSLRTLLEGPLPDDGWAAAPSERPAPTPPGPRTRPSPAGPPSAPEETGPRGEEGDGPRGEEGSDEAEARPEAAFAEDELEAFLRDARAGWERLLREPTPQALGRLEGEVRRLLHRAEALRRGTGEDEGSRAEVGGKPAGTGADARREEEAVGRTAESRRVEGGSGNRADGPGRVGGVEGSDAAAFPPFRDAGTGLLTREGFDALASGELKRSRRHGRPFALILLRPRVPEGEPLRTLGAGVRRSLRESDFVGRYGGVVLAVGLPETGAAEAQVVADRLRAEVERRGGWGDEAAAALAVHPRDGETLLTLADAARTRLIGGEAVVAADAENGQPAERGRAAEPGTVGE